MAETVKKGQRITGADRAKLAGELTKKYANGETAEKPAPVSEGVVPEEPGPEGGVAGQSNSGTQ
jgi:hypothetical protein